MSHKRYEKRAKPRQSRTIAAGAARRFLAPGKRRSHDQEVEGIVALAQEGRFPPPLYPVAAAVGFGPEDLMRLPPEVAAGVAEAQEALDSGPPKLRRNLMSLVESMGTHALLREHPLDLLAVLRTKAAQASALSFDRSIRCNEAAAGEAIGWASAEVTAVEAQRAINAGSRAMGMVLRADLTRVKLLAETAKAEKAGVPPEALNDEALRGKSIVNRLMSYWASQIDLSRSEVAKDMADASRAANRDATPYTVSEGVAAWSDRRPPAGSSGVEETMMPAGSRRPDQDSTEVEDASEGGPAWSERRHPAGPTGEEDTMMPAGQVAAEPRPRRRPDQERSETEREEAANRDTTPYTVSANNEGMEGRTTAGAPLTPLPLPLAERRAEASEILRALESPAAADDPADSWEVEVLGMAVRAGKASASIVARFVEEASTVPIFPEPGTANRPRPPMHHYLERLSPRGWPRVTATGSSSISLMASG